MVVVSWQSISIWKRRALDTFELARPADSIPGIVDYVTEYIDTGQAPDVSEYVFESSGIGNDGGGLWIMPSGAQFDRYPSTFAKIDWAELYERQDGYLLFEDLKAQWKATVKPDYVLVDSRTGHTDVGGICTRHLPGCSRDPVLSKHTEPSWTNKGRPGNPVGTYRPRKEENWTPLHHVQRAGSGR